MSSKVNLGSMWSLCAKVLTVASLLSTTCSMVWSNAPGRGTDQEIRSAQGAALTNAEMDKANRSGMNGEVNARRMRELGGTQQEPGRGSPESIREAEGAAVSNAQMIKSGEKVIPPSASPEHSNNPGGMMTPFLTH